MYCLVYCCSGFDQVSQEASRNLHSHAVDVLKLCWAVTPPEAADRHQLLHRLLPTKGWPVNSSCNPAGSSCEPCDPNDSAWLPLPSQRAQTAKMLLEQVSFNPEIADCIINHRYSLSCSLCLLCHRYICELGKLSNCCCFHPPLYCLHLFKELDYETCN